MAKLLKPLVVIVLLVSIAALVIQVVVLFPKRTLIKERTLKLESGIAKVVETLKGSSSLLSDEAKQAAPFNTRNLKVDKTEGLPTLDRELTRANTVAQTVLQGWQDTQNDLEQTRRDLEDTRAELQQTKAQLEEARTQIVQLNETIRAKDQQLIEQSNVIAGLEEEKSSLEVQLVDLNSQIDGLNNQIIELEEANTMLEELVRRYSDTHDSSASMAVGTTAKVVYVNPEWNFVLIDLGSAGGAKASAEMIVHRGDNMVGKIRISSVLEQVSIAEVMPEYQKAAIQEGDDVLF